MPTSLRISTYTRCSGWSPPDTLPDFREHHHDAQRREFVPPDPRSAPVVGGCERELSRCADPRHAVATSRIVAGRPGSRPSGTRWRSSVIPNFSSQFHVKQERHGAKSAAFSIFSILCPILFPTFDLTILPPCAFLHLSCEQSRIAAVSRTTIFSLMDRRVLCCANLWSPSRRTPSGRPCTPLRRSARRTW